MTAPRTRRTPTVEDPQERLRQRLDHLPLSRKEGFKKLAEAPARTQPELLTRTQLAVIGEAARAEYDRARRKWHANLGPLRTCRPST